MNNLQTFNNPEFGEIRTIQRDGEPWFVGKDVAAALGYEKPTDAVRKRVDEEDKGVSKMETPQGAQDMIIINESGLYCLIFSSKLEKAKRFKSWVTHEVLPSIRRTGGYQTAHMSPEVSPQGLAKLINITRRVMLDMGSTPVEVAAMVQSVFITYHVPVPYALAKNVPEQLSLYDLPALQPGV